MTQRSPSTAQPPGALGRIADFAFVHRRRVLLGWLAVLAVAIAAAATFGGTYTADYSTPGSDSKAAADRLAQSFSGRSGDQVDIVWKAPAGATAPAVEDRIDRLLKHAEQIDGVVPGTRASDAEVAPDGRTAVVRLPLDRPSSALPASSGEQLRELVQQAGSGAQTGSRAQAGSGAQASSGAPAASGTRVEAGPDLEVAANGSVAGLKQEAGMNAELIGIAVAALVLMLTFGTVVAAGLPLVSALFGVGVAATFGGVLAAVLDTPDWALQVSLMIGIGVGIDYALLILTRYRSAVHAGKDRRAANVEAMATAGHSVLTAGATVVISLMGLFLMRLPYLYGVALSSSLAVLVVLAASITLLPALIGFAGDRIDKLQLLRFGRPPADPERTPGTRWSRLVLRRPALATVAALVLLAVLTSPLTGIRFGFPDAGNDPATATTRQAYAMIADGFGPGANGPLIAVAATERPQDRAAVATLTRTIAADPDVAAVAAPQYNDSGDTALIAITPQGSPESTSTKELVDRLRDGALREAGVRVDLGGQTAASVDQGSVTAKRLPLFIGAVIALSFVLLLAAFRAPVIALKAGVMNLLSIGAAYGVVSLVAEGGWAGRLVGIDTDLPVPPFIPVMMFAVLFGLSMDYEVFLVSRIREERRRLGSASAGVAVGLARTSKVIVAAAAIMVAVFGAFALSPDVMLKLIGIGLATAILIDATLVRMVLVPAVMKLLGERAWWAQRRLRRLSPAAAH